VRKFAESAELAMDFIAHHLTAVYVFAAIVLGPLLVWLVWQLSTKRQARRARDAMLKGNRLHRRWLEGGNVNNKPSVGHKST
jgi:Flp pilus assembly protein TadB